MLDFLYLLGGSGGKGNAGKSGKNVDKAEIAFKVSWWNFEISASKQLLCEQTKVDKHSIYQVPRGAYMR